MTIRHIALALLTGSATAVFVSCNSSEESVEYTASNAAVKTFNIGSDSKILAGLDSVFFSIDLVKGQIFNADSLPGGTRVTSLVPKIVTYDVVSVAELTVSRAGRADTVINYLTNSSDSIDFTNPVKLRIVSSDGTVERQYTIKVNVHRSVADSLAWGRNDRTVLPSSFGYPAEQRTVRRGDSFYCLTRSGSNYCLASFSRGVDQMNAAMPAPADWQKDAVTFGFTPDINSFAANDDHLFILDTDGNLYTSVDGLSWQSAAMKWYSVLGGYRSTMLGTVHTADGWKIQSWPSGTLAPLPAGMPVSGASVPVEYSFEMSDISQILIVGGRKADGALSADTWGYDGYSWVKISQNQLPVALEGMAVAPYYTLDTTDAWNTLEMPSLIAFGGRDASGLVNGKVYYSNDYGYHWAEAPESLQLPSYLTPTYNAQAYVMATETHGMLYQPKVSRPEVEWECPYIYMFGGMNAGSTLQNTVWRGVVLHFTFTPVL